MPKEKLSVTIIAFNEEKNIRACLESVKWADEIIVVDSESTDKTRDISQEYTPNVFIKKWEGFAPQRKFALEKVSHNWALAIDADERVSNELKVEIESLLEDIPKAEGYQIPRRNYFLDKVIKTCFWYPDYQLRLFRKDKVSVTDRKVHEGYEVNGVKERLGNDLIHFTHQDIGETISKINSYSSLQAEERYISKKIKPRDIIIHPIAAFMNHFISRKGYKDGVYGLMVSLIHSMTNMMTYMKIWELQNVKNKNEEKKSG
ncbi:MAG: glycosyltransferase family 2 protein [bacterium]